MSAATPAAPPSANVRPVADALSAEQLALIVEAQRRTRTLRRAAAYAAISGWTLAFFAFLSLLGGLSSAASLLLGIALAIVAYFEIRGSRALKRFDPGAPRQLGFNQIALCIIVVLYAGWQIFGAISGPGRYAQYANQPQQVTNMLESISNLERVVMVAVYGLLIVGTLIAQGIGAIYHFTRARHVRAFLQNTPRWTIEVLRRAA